MRRTPLPEFRKALLCRGKGILRCRIRIVVSFCIVCARCDVEGVIDDGALAWVARCDDVVECGFDVFWVDGGWRLNGVDDHGSCWAGDVCDEGVFDPLLNEWGFDDVSHAVDERQEDAARVDDVADDGSALDLKCFFLLFARFDDGVNEIT